MFSSRDLLHSFMNGNTCIRPGLYFKGKKICRESHSLIKKSGTQEKKRFGVIFCVRDQKTLADLSTSPDKKGVFLGVGVLYFVIHWMGVGVPTADAQM